MDASLEEAINVGLENVAKAFSNEDIEFNRRMVNMGNQVNNIIRGNLRVDRMGGKVLRYGGTDESREDDYDFTSQILKNY